MKLFVSDLDGTLFKDGDDFSAGCNAENFKAIQNWVEAGNVFAVATARPLAMKQEIFDEIGCAVNIIGCNGAEIHLLNGKSYFETIDAKATNEIQELSILNNWDATMFYISDELNHVYDNFYPFINKIKPLSFADFSKKLEGVNDDKKLLKAVLSIRPEQRDRVKEVLKDKYGTQFSFVSSDIDTIDIGSLTCSKGTGVKRLAKYLNISTEQVITIGDSENDISMFEVVTTSYCMSQAEDYVKEKASFVVESVAGAIEIELAK